MKILWNFWDIHVDTLVTHHLHLKEVVVRVDISEGWIRRFLDLYKYLGFKSRVIFIVCFQIIDKFKIIVKKISKGTAQ